MTRKADRASDYARIALAGTRLFNGIAALFVPAALARRLGVDPETDRAALYVLRLFGVSTILIGVQLLLRDEGLRAHSLRERETPGRRAGLLDRPGHDAHALHPQHNAIYDRLCAEYPAWSDDDLFDRARLKNTVLLAKIHTIEWTPALLDHPTARRGLSANWWDASATASDQTRLGRSPWKLRGWVKAP